MLRRNRVLLIRGTLPSDRKNISKQLTRAPYERLNLDHLVLSIVLRYPHLIPPEMDSEILSESDTIIAVSRNLEKFLEHFVSTFDSSLIISEYASVASDRQEVKLVEGVSLEYDWIYHPVKTLHKQWGQVVMDVQLTAQNVIVDDRQLSWEDALSWLTAYIE